MGAAVADKRRRITDITIMGCLTSARIGGGLLWDGGCDIAAGSYYSNWCIIAPSPRRLCAGLALMKQMKL